MKLNIIAISILFSLLNATIINVPTTEYPSVQAGINQAVEGDTVLVAQGTYYENLIINKEITLLSTVDFEEEVEGLEDWHENQIIKETIINGETKFKDGKIVSDKKGQKLIFSR